MKKAVSICFAVIFLTSSVYAAGQGIDESFFKDGSILDNPGAKKEELQNNIEQGTLPNTSPISSIDTNEIAKSGMRVIGSLIFVAVLIFGIYKLGKKAKLPFFSNEGIVKKVAVEPIGPNQFINIVEVGDRMLVLGISEKGISMLTELSGESREIVRMKRAENSQKGKREGNFSDILSSLTGLINQDSSLHQSSSSRNKINKILAESLIKEKNRIRESAL